jgi:hypothetical protein
MLVSVTAQDEIRAAQSALADGFAKTAGLGVIANVGFMGGMVAVQVYWVGRLGIWGSFNVEPLGELHPAARERYWNAFGTQNPAESRNLSITCEINPPHSGTYRRTAGLYAKESGTGQTFVLHRGTIGGGRPGIGREEFWKRWRGRTESVLEEQVDTTCAVVCCLDNQNFPDEIAEFVHDIREIKASILGR